MIKSITKNSEPKTHKRLLLCTDLDRTLIPNGDQPESDHAREYFKKLSEHSEVTLVYVTGRHQQLVEQAHALLALRRFERELQLFLRLGEHHAAHERQNHARES